MSATEYPSFIVRSSTGPTMPWPARSSRRLETVALALAICLPVPMFAVMGLSLPLPNFVERIAAALVPWADPVTLEAGELPRGASGSIVPAVAAADAGPSSVVLGAVAATLSVKRSVPAPVAAKPSAATPAASRPAATGGGATPVPAPTALPTASDEPAREPVAVPKPAETPTKLAPGVTETVPAPPVPLPEPIPIVPPFPTPLPAPVQEAVDVVAIADDPVGTVDGVVGGVVGGIVPAPGGTTPLPLPGLGK